MRLVHTNLHDNMHINVHGNNTSMYGVQGPGGAYSGRCVDAEEGSEAQIGLEAARNKREVQVRCLSITKSPVAPPFELNVVIAPKGVEKYIV